MIELRQTTLVQADFTEPFDDRVDILFRELELATKWQCPSLLLAIYSSEFVHGDAELALENRLQDLGQKAHHIVVKGEDDADIPLLITELKDLQDTIVFVDGLQWGCSQADYAAYRCLDKHREFFIENRIRVVFWLTETEAIHLAHYAPDCWTLRHRVIEFVDAPRLEQIQPQLADLPCAVPDELTGAVEDLDAKITLRTALLTDLPEGVESTAARANLLLTLGILHWRRGEYDQSLQFLNTAMELAGKLQDNRFEGLCFNALALVDSALGKTREAIQAYTRAVELAPDQINPWANLGHLNFKLEQYPDALAAYQKAVEANPVDAASWAGLADTQAKLKSNEDAVFAYRKTLELDPQNSHAWISLGDVYTAEGQWDDALTAYQKGIEMEPSNARVWNELGNLHFNAAAHQDALNDYQQAIQLGHETSQSCSNLAEIHIRDGKFAEAAPLLQKAIDLQADAAQKATLWTRLAEIYRKLNQYDQAIEAYRKADELDLESADTQSMAAVEAVPIEPASEPVVPCEETPLPEPTLESQPEGAAPTLTEEPQEAAPVPEPAPAEAAPEAAGLIDDSASLVNESEVDFVHWLESLAEKVPPLCPGSRSPDR